MKVIQKTYIFLPGAWHGAWVYDPIIKRLKLLGKKCIAITLPGLESKQYKESQLINLETHIQFVVDFLNQNNITDIILCGHSYAGMVITGVADKIPEKIYGLVYIDAYVPKNGDSCWNLTSDAYRNLFVKGAGENGITVGNPPGKDRRRRPHPLATFMQNLHLKGDYKKIHNRAFIYLSGWDETPFLKQYEKLKKSKGWHVETIHSIHNVMKEKPDQLTDILCKLENKFT
ncbi:pimeloyl-ACP methyl ester carboxylesterase [Pedobacter sp. W3I1]|uniref:alpha/beta fold hydrolase n=1 Tax=Pedobacter sp. W3I1 TaxID=3042291 RepID=UPI0027843C04|nr:alpha/beta hydrolase [Pedobacter sp. W3I1]MDQ0638893.1 pimeloyl-ACP methyl ester carboxylesterase [Pedobacter sp. W3I1]